MRTLSRSENAPRKLNRLTHLLARSSTSCFGKEDDAQSTSRENNGRKTVSLSFMVNAKATSLVRPSNSTSCSSSSDICRLLSFL